jgi:ABC-type transport system involved in multi-copper enzyme maturation permease subunit
MIGMIAAELLVLRKRSSTWVLLGVWCLLEMVFAYFVPYLDYRNDVREGRAFPGLAPLLPDRLVERLIVDFPFYGGAIALIFGVLTLGGDYNWGTLKTLFTQRPGRLKVLSAKLIAQAIALVPFVIASFVLGMVASIVIALIENGDISAPAFWPLVRALGAGWFVMSVWAALGIALAVLSRGTSMAIGIGLLWAFAIEGLVSNLLDTSAFFRPVIKFFVRANAYSLVRSLSGITGNQTQDGPGRFAGPYVGAWQAALVLSGYLLVFGGFAALLLRRRDVV